MNIIENYKSCIETGNYQVWVCDYNSYVLINFLLIIFLIGVLIYFYRKKK